MSDIRDTLAQLDRRLSDLKREIASIGDEPASAPPPPRRPAPAPPPANAGEPAAAESLVGAAQQPGAQTPPASRTQEPLAPAPDVPSSIPAFAPPPLPDVTRPAAPPPPAMADPAAHQPPRAGPGPAPGPGSAGSTPTPTPTPTPPAPGPAGAQSGDAGTHEIVGRAEAEAARLLAHAHERVDELKSQIEQLLGVRERMLQSARDLVRQYEEEVTQLELRYPATTPAEATAAGEAQAAPAPPPPPGPVTPAASAAGVPPPGAPPTGAPPVGAPAAGYAQHAVPPPPPPAPEPAPRPALFEGVVSVIVPWVSRLQTIQVLEDSLTRVRGAQLAHVRGYHQGEVRLELVLGEAVDLIGELNRTLPYAFAVESARQDEIIIRLERGEAGGAGVQ